MKTDLLNLIHLHELDQEIIQLQKILKNIPKEIQELEKSTNKFLELIDSKKKQIEKVQNEKSKLEKEIDILQDKKSKFKEQVKLIKTNKEYNALLQEIKMQEDAIRAVEDEIIEKMELIENLQLELQEIIKEYEKEDQIIQEKKKEILKKKENTENLIKIKEKYRQETVNIIPDFLLQKYNKIASYKNGSAMAEVKDEICTSCNVRLRPQLWEDLKKMDQLFECESCHKILYIKY